MIFLGLSGLAHDAAVAIAKDGRVIFAIEEERVTRRKGDWCFPYKSIQFALDKCNIGLSDVDGINFYWDDFGFLMRSAGNEMRHIFAPHVPTFRRVCKRVSAASSNKKVVKNLSKIWKNIPLPPVNFIDHHETHILYAYYASGYEKCAGLIVDGRGESATTSIYSCESGKVRSVWQQHMPASLGYIYAAVTQHLGFEPLSDEYRVMGLASYGKHDKSLKTFFDNLITFDGEDISVDYKWLNYQKSETLLEAPWLSARSYDALGEPRHSGGYLTDAHRNIAYAIQARYEEIFIELVKKALRETGMDMLVLGGGCAMNSVANGKLLQSGLIKNLFIPPAPGDQGCAIGASLKKYPFADITRNYLHNSKAALGPSYTNREIQQELDNNKLKYRLNVSSIEIAKMIASGRIGAIFQDEMEFGPRALGNRSILADPRNANNRDRLNSIIKQREQFRPFAGIIFEDNIAEYFIDAAPSKYMNLVFQVTKDKANDIPAIVHADGSCRIQTIERKSNKQINLLLHAFEDLTGVPLLINTSFNVKGEPIVMSPKDALRCFYSTGLDFLVIGDFFLQKD